MAKSTFDEKKKFFAESLMSTPTKVTMQSVEVIEKQKNKGNKKEVSEQISAWISSDLMEKVKIKMIKDKKKLTALLEELLENYLTE
jgi:hydroxymethylpyrimidine/phosphomethylpyrimidine kinase